MIETLLIGGSISLIIAALTAYLLLRIVRQELTQLRTHLQSQETQQQHWREAQEHLIADLQQKLSQQFEHFQVTHTKREKAEHERFDALISQYESLTQKARIEYALAQLPRVEDIPLPAGNGNHNPQHSSAHHTPSNLQGYDLSDRDLSSRYLSHADLRQANLTQAKLYMADLSGADLSGADLSNAELSGADLRHANLRGAILRGANLLVADLNHAVLLGSDLRDVHSLSLEQVSTTVYDASTRFDPKLAESLPSLSASKIARPFAAAQEAARLEDTDKETSRMRAIPKAQITPPLLDSPAELLPITDLSSKDLPIEALSSEDYPSANPALEALPSEDHSAELLAVEALPSEDHSAELLPIEDDSSENLPIEVPSSENLPIETLSSEDGSSEHLPIETHASKDLPIEDDSSEDHSSENLPIEDDSFEKDQMIIAPLIAEPVKVLDQG